MNHLPLEPNRQQKTLTINTKSYFSKFILFTALTPSTATSAVHPNTCKNLLLNFLLIASSSTSNTLRGTAHPGTNVDLLTLSFCAPSFDDTMVFDDEPAPED